MYCKTRSGIPAVPVLNTAKAAAVAQTKATTPLSPRPPVTPSQRRLFHASIVVWDFSRDFLFGGTDSNVREMALKHRRSADFNLTRYSASEGGGSPVDYANPEMAAARMDYLSAHKQFVRGGGSEVGFSRASEEFRFTPLRQNLLRPNARYSDFMASIVNVVNARGGNFAFTFDRFDFMEHFASRAAVESARKDGNPAYNFVQYTEECTMGQRHTETGDRLPHASYTSMEAAMFLEGRYKGLPVTYLNPAGEELDLETVQTLYGEAAGACSSPENLAHMKANGGEFAPKARDAVVALHSYVHGTKDILPIKSKWEVNNPKRINARLAFGLPSEIGPKDEL